MLADVNGDGKLDIIVGDYGNNNVSVLLGNGNGTFGPIVVSTGGSRSAALAVGISTTMANSISSSVLPVPLRTTAIRRQA